MTTALAPLASPAFTGAPTGPTPGDGDNSTKLATTAFVHSAVAALVASSPELLSTLKELADAINDDPNFSATITAALAGKLAKAANLSDVANAGTARANLGAMLVWSGFGFVDPTTAGAYATTAAAIADGKTKIQIGAMNDGAAATMGEYDATTGAPINANLITGLNGPAAMGLSGNNLYVVSSGGNTVGEFNATTGAPINASFITGLSNPVGIAISGNNLYVANYSAGSIGEYNATNGTTINSSFVSGLQGPQFLALSGNNLLVSEFSSYNDIDLVGEYDATSGATINASFITGLSIPQQLALSGNNLYVANQGTGTVGEYDATSGNQIKSSFLSGLSNPSALAVTPEPGCVVLCLVGAASLLSQRKRWRRMPDVC